MKRFCYFIKSLFPVVMVFILQIVAAIPTMLFFLFRASGDAKPALNELLASLSGLTSDMEYLQTLNLVYAILALLVFGTWYYKIFVKPFRHRRKKYPSGYSFHTITSMFFLGIGLQYVTTMLTDAIGVLRPDLITAYHTMICHCCSWYTPSFSHRLLKKRYSADWSSAMHGMPCHSGLQISCRLHCSDLYT